MDKKSVENLIEDSLNSQKPDKTVLSSAKEIMKKPKEYRAKNTLRFLAAASCSVVLIIVGIILVVPFQSDNTSMSSMSANTFNVSAEFYGLIIGTALILAGIVVGIFTIIFKIKSKKR